MKKETCATDSHGRKHGRFPDKDSIKFKMWHTKGVRFQARSRLNNMERASNLSISLLSLYAIAVSLGVILFPINNDVLKKGLEAASVILPIFIIIASNCSINKKYALISDRMGCSADKILKLYNEFLAKEKVIKAEYSFDEYTKSRDYVELEVEFYRRYSDILSDYPADHEAIDNDYFRAIRRKDMEGEFCWFRHKFYYLKLCAFIWWSVFCILIIPITAFSVILWF